MENKKISFQQFCDPEYRRREQLKIKSEATWLAFHELDGMINVSKFTRHYLKKSQSWFVQKLEGMDVCNKRREFTSDEYTAISNSLRALAKRLNEYADIIDSAQL